MSGLELHEHNDDDSSSEQSEESQEEEYKKEKGGRNGGKIAMPKIKYNQRRSLMSADLDRLAADAANRGE